ncbi:MAG: hypothetical protein QW404_03580, partial [Candidatus Nanoarchaeia archaeon]
VYVLLMFIFLRPGTQPVYSQSNLLSIVDENLVKDASYNIERTVLFIRPNPSYFPPPGTYQLSIENVDLPPGVGSSKHFLLLSNDSKPINFDIKLTGTKKDYLRFYYTFNKVSSIYVYLLNSSEVDYSGYQTSIPENHNNPFYDPAIKPHNFTYEFGVTETLTGFSHNKLADIKDYSTLKKRWNFPVDKDFSVLVTEVSNNNRLLDINNVELAPNINVFANSYHDWVLEPNAVLVPVNVTIRVW